MILEIPYLFLRILHRGLCVVIHHLFLSEKYLADRRLSRLHEAVSRSTFRNIFAVIQGDKGVLTLSVSQL